MIQPPGWNSIDTTAFWSSFYFWAGIVSLALLAATEVLSHRYGSRHDELVRSANESEVNTLKAQLIAQGHRTISAAQHQQLVDLLTPIQIPKDVIFFNPLTTDGEAVAFSDQIKSVLSDSGFPVEDVPFGDRLISYSPLGVHVWIKDLKNQPARARYIYEAFKRINVIMAGEVHPEFPDAEKVVIVVGTYP
jgi:hypothetical protein